MGGRGEEREKNGTGERRGRRRRREEEEETREKKKNGPRQAATFTLGVLTASKPQRSGSRKPTAAANPSPQLVRGKMGRKGWLSTLLGLSPGQGGFYVLISLPLHTLHVGLHPGYWHSYSSSPCQRTPAHSPLAQTSKYNLLLRLAQNKKSETKKEKRESERRTVTLRETPFRFRKSTNLRFLEILYMSCMYFPPSNNWELEPVQNKRSLQRLMFRHNPTRSQAETTVNCSSLKSAEFTKIASSGG